MKDDLIASLSALRHLAMGGPFAVAFVAAGSSVLAVAVTASDRHYDVLLVLGVTGVVLGFTEWALARRFAAHEKVERENFAELAMTAESAGSAALETVRSLRELRVQVEEARQMAAAAAATVTSLERRVTNIEDRFMRPAITVPPIRRGPVEGE